MITNDSVHPSPVTDASFEQDVTKTSGVVMVDFWATWCGPCHMIAPIVDQIAGEYAGKAKVLKLDTDANPGTSARFGIRSIPSILFFKDGVEVDRAVGALPKAALEQKLLKHL